MSRSTRRLRPLAVSAATATALALALMPAAHAEEADDDAVQRIHGENRYATAAAVSNEQFDDEDANAVVLARGDDYADSLAGGALAAEEDAPLLLTQVGNLPEVTEAEINRVLGGSGTVYLLGGTSAISTDVQNAIIDMGLGVQRISGSDRYETAVAVANRIGSDGPALVGTGQDYSDALTASAAASAGDGVVLLTNDGHLPQVTAGYLDDADHGEVFAIGGPAARALVTAPGVDAENVFGQNRWETAIEVAERFFTSSDGFFTSPDGFVVASGQNFPDALASAAFSGGEVGGPVLLAQGNNLPNVTAKYISEIAKGDSTAHNPPPVDLDAYLIGGESALSASVLEQTENALSGDDEPPANG